MTSEVFGTGGGERLADRARREAARRGAARRAHPRGRRRRDAARPLRPGVASRPGRSPRSRATIDAQPRRRLHPHAAACLLTPSYRAMPSLAAALRCSPTTSTTPRREACTRSRARPDRLHRTSLPDLESSVAGALRVVSEPGYDALERERAVGPVLNYDRSRTEDRRARPSWRGWSWSNEARQRARPTGRQLPEAGPSPASDHRRPTPR